MMSFGFIAELITSYQGHGEDAYSVAELAPQPTPAHEHQQT